MLKSKIRSLHHFLSGSFQTIHLEYKVLPRPRFGQGSAPHDVLYKNINQSRNIFAGHLTSFLKYENEFKAIKHATEEKDENNPGWNNGYLPGLDIISLYGLIRQFKPKQYIEVGSGNSTKVVKKAIVEGNLSTTITSIDPFPRASIDHLADKIIRSPFESLQDYKFITEGLNDGDILFIDNSHRLFPNSDVMVFFFGILPYLKKGVIVHVHDIYLPYDYPQFMCDRFYNEQYALGIALMNSGEKYQLIFPSYFVSEDKELSAILNPLWNALPADIERHGGSFWFRIS